MNFLLKKGDVFSRIVKKFPLGEKTFITQYWKVTDEPRKSWINRDGYSYPVVRCSKTGKEYKDKNGFCTSIDAKLNDPECNEYQYIGNFEPGKKANIDNGIKTGKIKRRISYLIGRITSDTKELNILKDALRQDMMDGRK